MNILNSGRFSMGSSGAGILKKLIGKLTRLFHTPFFLKSGNTDYEKKLGNFAISVWVNMQIHAVIK